MNLIRTQNWMMEKLKPQLETFKLTIQQFDFQRILCSFDVPLSTTQIRDPHAR
jgi:hypothetical protein